MAIDEKRQEPLTRTFKFDCAYDAMMNFDNHS